jgi:hypothetical protein
MRHGRYPDRALTGRGMDPETGVDPWTRVAVADRMRRLQAEAEHERLARALRVPARRISARARLGHAVMFLGCLIEGAGSQENDCGRLLRA